METYAAVRWFVFVEGKSRREAARVFGLSRDRVAKMCRYSAPPDYVRSREPEWPKLGPLVPVIDAILEADKPVPPKQRHTAKRIFERLRIELGFAGGYTVVKDYVRLARTRARERWCVIATNLVLINDEILEFCKDHDILISTSLDGPSDLHNANHPRPGNDSYERAIEGISRVRNALEKDTIEAGMHAASGPTLTFVSPRITSAACLARCYAQLRANPVAARK